MIVSELINKLKQLNPDMSIIMYDVEYNIETILTPDRIVVGLVKELSNDTRLKLPEDPDHFLSFVGF